MKECASFFLLTLESYVFQQSTEDASVLFASTSAMTSLGLEERVDPLQTHRLPMTTSVSGMRRQQIGTHNVSNDHRYKKTVVIIHFYRRTGSSRHRSVEHTTIGHTPAIISFSDLKANPWQGMELLLVCTYRRIIVECYDRIRWHRKRCFDHLKQRLLLFLSVYYHLPTKKPVPTRESESMYSYHATIHEICNDLNGGSHNDCNG
jgi:hypothetical protein